MGEEVGPAAKDFRYGVDIPVRTTMDGPRKYAARVNDSKGADMLYVRATTLTSIFAVTIGYRMSAASLTLNDTDSVSRIMAACRSY